MNINGKMYKIIFNMYIVLPLDIAIFILITMYI